MYDMTSSNENNLLTIEHIHCRCIHSHFYIKKATEHANDGWISVIMVKVIPEGISHEMLLYIFYSTFLYLSHIHK